MPTEIDAALHELGENVLCTMVDADPVRARRMMEVVISNLRYYVESGDLELWELQGVMTLSGLAELCKRKGWGDGCW